MKRIPTQADVEAILARLSEHPAVTEVVANPVLEVRVRINNESCRHEVYDIEREIMKDYPGLALDFGLRVGK